MRSPLRVDVYAQIRIIEGSSVYIEDTQAQAQQQTLSSRQLKQVLPGFEPGLLDSKSKVITNYTIEPTIIHYY